VTRELALLGDKDEILKPALEARIREQLPHARLHLVPGGGHGLQNTVSERFLPLVGDFIRSPAFDRSKDAETRLPEGDPDYVVRAAFGLKRGARYSCSVIRRGGRRA
jgi:hypothetical protein